MPKNVEIEIQVQVENIEPLMKFLKKKAKFVGNKHQIDEYITPPHRDFAAKRPVSEWLRIRQNGDKNSIDYKFWHRDSDGKTNHCDEFGCSVNDIEQVRNIFNVLGFKPVVKVDKHREIYLYQNYEIAIDHVSQLGDFLEIEYKGETDQTPAQITEGMVAFLKKIGVGKITRNYVGYAFMLLSPDEEFKTEEL
jgi:predicted adenylyl cyclase CyaB